MGDSPILRMNSVGAGNFGAQTAAPFQVVFFCVHRVRCFALFQFYRTCKRRLNKMSLLEITHKSCQSLLLYKFTELSINFLLNFFLYF